MSFDDLVTALQHLDGLKVKGKTGQNFYVKSRAFLHFHGSDTGTYADVRFGADWERVPAATSPERSALLARVQAHLRVAG